MCQVCEPGIYDPRDGKYCTAHRVWAFEEVADEDNYIANETLLGQTENTNVQNDWVDAFNEPFLTLLLLLNVMILVHLLKSCQMSEKQPKLKEQKHQKHGGRHSKRHGRQLTSGAPTARARAPGRQARQRWGPQLHTLTPHSSSHTVHLASSASTQSCASRSLWRHARQRCAPQLHTIAPSSPQAVQSLFLASTQTCSSRASCSMRSTASLSSSAEACACMQIWHQTLPHPLHCPNVPQLLLRRRSRHPARLHGPGEIALKLCWQSGTLGKVCSSIASTTLGRI